MARIALLLVGIMLVAPSTGGAQQPDQPTATTLEPLRWLVGTWRGTEKGEKWFFEGYEMVGDSLLRIRYFADSTTSVVADSGKVYVRDDTIYHEAGGGIWRAVALDSVSVRFEPHQRVTNSFSWVREGHDAWVATLEMPGRAPTVYRLERWQPRR